MGRQRLSDVPEIPIAPMIDCVFLMLVYFMTTSSLEKSEADLAFPSGQAGLPTDPLPAIDEQQLVLQSSGQVIWNGFEYPILEGEGTTLLRNRMEAFRETCRQAGSDPSLLINPEPGTPHQAVVSLLDIVTMAGIDMVHFP